MRRIIVQLEMMISIPLSLANCRVFIHSLWTTNQLTMIRIILLMIQNNQIHLEASEQLTITTQQPLISPELQPIHLDLQRLIKKCISVIIFLLCGQICTIMAERSSIVLVIKLAVCPSVQLDRAKLSSIIRRSCLSMWI